MSRAFVTDDKDNEPDLPPLRSPLPPGARNYMTPEGALRLQEEIERLTLRERPKLAATIAHAGSGGSDASSAELSDAQHEMKLLDRRIEYLSELKRTAEVVRHTAGPAERVAFGAAVTVRDETGRTTEKYTIVGVYESEPEAGMVSWISPVAKALMGKRPGDTVTLTLPAGDRTLRVESVVFP